MDRHWAADPILTVALANFDLGGEPRSEPLPQGRARGSVVVTTNAGRYVARALGPRLAAPAAVQLRHAFVAHLAAQGLCVPRFVPTRAGECVARVPGGVIEVQESVEGRPLSAAMSGDTALAGEAVAALHRAGEGFDPPTRPSFSVEPELAQLGRMERQMQTYLPAPEVLEQMFHVKHCLSEGARALGNAALPAGMLHGDLRPAHLLLDAEGRVWVTSYDACQWGPLLLDVADLAHHFGEDAVAAYAQRRLLTEAERRLGAAAEQVMLIRRGLAEGSGVSALAGRLKGETG
jgi:Ser/Thr protein kinase RdoA (MazF antagonist)